MGARNQTGSLLPIAEGRIIMPRGASPKREREYRKLKESFKSEGRYKGREEEVASRIVNRQRSDYGETKGRKQQEKEKTHPDRNLPIEGYRHLTVGSVVGRLGEFSRQQLRKIRDYERQHKNRKTLITELEKRM